MKKGPICPYKIILTLSDKTTEQTERITVQTEDDTCK